ncbi:MAG TPA: AAA family ATPase, partial [Gammaproteobacteria bacterium]|nr:AAA family ATPase [Gammaproteobacteria bacterium]
AGGGGGGSAGETPAATQAPDLAAADSFDFKAEVQEFEINLLKQAMEQNQFNQKKAAEFLNLSYHQLRGYLRKYDLLN